MFDNIVIDCDICLSGDCLASFKLFYNIWMVTFASRVFVWLYIICLITL